jgi:hypothetical protein
LTARRLTGGADALRLALVCSAGAWFAAGDPSAALKALLVLPAALLGRFVPIDPTLDLLFSLALFSEANRTGLGAYDSISSGDTLPHLVLPLLLAPIVYAGLVRIGAAAERPATPSVRFAAGAALVAAASVLAIGTLWELVEWAADGVFGTNFSQGYRDTLSDLLADTVAAIGGGALVAVRLRAGVSRRLQKERA